MFPKTPDLVTYFRSKNGKGSVDGIAALCMTLLLTAVILSGIRAQMDNSWWPVVVCVLNTLSVTFLTIDFFFFAFTNFPSMFCILCADSICTVGNVIMCVTGTISMRSVSAVVLVMFFLAKGIIATYLFSTVLRILTIQDIVKDVDNDDEDEDLRLS